MAVGVAVLNSGNASPARLGRGLKLATGRIGFSANSAFVASTVERLFRCRCENIQVCVPSGYVVQFKRSTTFKKGMLYAFAISALSGIATPLVNHALPVCSGTFTAYGF